MTATLLWGAAVILAGLYGLAVVGHLRAPATLTGVADVIGVPARLIPAIPALEAAIVVLLAGAPAFGAGVAAAHVAAATLAVASARLRGRTLEDCGCFGNLVKQGATGGLYARNTAMLVLATALALVGPAGRPIGAGVLALFAALAVAAAYRNGWLGSPGPRSRGRSAVVTAVPPVATPPPG